MSTKDGERTPNAGAAPAEERGAGDASRASEPTRAARVAVSKYEYARLMSARVTALARNAPPCTRDRPGDGVGGLLQLAEAEFAQGVLPLDIVRRLPSGQLCVCPASLLYRIPDRTPPLAADATPPPTGGQSDTETAARSDDPRPTTSF